MCWDYIWWLMGIFYRKTMAVDLVFEKLSLNGRKGGLSLSSSLLEFIVLSEKMHWFYLWSQHQWGSPHLQTSGFTRDALKCQSAQAEPREQELRWSRRLHSLCSRSSRYPKYRDLATSDFPFVLQFLPLSFLLLLIFAFMQIKSCLISEKLVFCNPVSR